MKLKKQFQVEFEYMYEHIAIYDAFWNIFRGYRPFVILMLDIANLHIYHFYTSDVFYIDFYYFYLSRD